MRLVGGIDEVEAKPRLAQITDRKLQVCADKRSFVQPFFAGFFAFDAALLVFADLASASTALAAALFAGSLFFGLAGFGSSEASGVSFTFFGVLPDFVASPSPGESWAGTSSLLCAFFPLPFLAFGFSAESWPCA
jgi:hypothetical protein